MQVKNLIKQLSKLDQNMQVGLYNSSMDEYFDFSILEQTFGCIIDDGAILQAPTERGLFKDDEFILTKNVIIFTDENCDEYFYPFSEKEIERLKI